MQKFFTLSLLFLLLAFTGYAFENRLTINSNSNSSIQVSIDGRTYSLDKNRNDAALLLQDMRPGARNIKIFAQKNQSRGWANNNNSQRNQQLLYNGNVYVRDGIDIDISVNRFGKVFIDEQPLARFSNSDGYNYPGTYDGDRNNLEMSSRSFEQLRQALSRERFEETRLNMAKSGISSNHLSTLQVRELLGQFSFEANKLEMAKFCYQYATDKQNYYNVADAFSYSSSRNELMRFLQQQR